MFIFVKVQNMYFHWRTHDSYGKTSKSHYPFLCIFTIFFYPCIIFDIVYEKEAENLCINHLPFCLLSCIIITLTFA